jgi:lipid-A-disaccharide synthase-like uncharacterized protein
MDTTTLIGTSGAALILITFVLNQSHKLSNDSLIYDALNFIGSGLLLLYAILLSSLPFAILNSVWAIISLRDIFRDLKSAKK